jgi:hypothetical protein
LAGLLTCPDFRKPSHGNVLIVAGFPGIIITLSVIRHHSSGYCSGFKPPSLFIAMIQFTIATPMHDKNSLIFRNEKNQISTGVENPAGNSAHRLYLHKYELVK